MFATDRVLCANAIQPPQKTEYSNIRLEIAIAVLTETPNTPLSKLIVQEICNLDPWVKAQLMLYDPTITTKNYTSISNMKQEA